MGSNETATATTGGPRVIGVFVTVAAGSIAVSLSRMTSNCDPEVSRRPRQVGTRRVQTPTHIPPPLPSVYTHQARCLAVRGPQAHLPKSYQSYQFWIQSSLGSTKHRCMRPRRLPDPRPVPEGVREPTYIRKKYVIWTRWRPVPVKNVNYPRAPSSRRSGLVGPYTTPTIVN